jgi:hypothetical protein
MKKNKKIIEKLTLNKQTIANLNSTMIVQDTNQDTDDGNKLALSLPNPHCISQPGNMWNCPGTSKPAPKPQATNANITGPCVTSGGIACTIPYTCSAWCNP